MEFKELEKQMFERLGITPRPMTKEEMGQAWQTIPKKIKKQMKKITNKELPKE